MKKHQLPAYHAKRIQQINNNIKLLQDERHGKGLTMNRLEDINHRLPFLHTEVENLISDHDGSKYGKSKFIRNTTRAELINRLRNREVSLTGGQMTRGTNFELKHFKDTDLKRMLESSRPLGSQIKTNRQASHKPKGGFVIKDTYQQQNINMDHDKSHHKEKGIV